MSVFGLDLRCALSLPYLSPAGWWPGGRRLDLRLDLAHHPRPWCDGRVLCTRRGRDGLLEFSIASHPQRGFQIWGAHRGSFELSAGRDRLWCAPEGPAAVWQRFLIGQVLPFAALAAGLEIMHASAVVLDGRAIALAGPSGAGKTSLALELCRRGAHFLTDDVLALERARPPIGHHRDGAPEQWTPTAYPGPPIVGVDWGELGRLRAAGAAAAGTAIWSDAREQVRAVQAAGAPSPVGALFFLDRRSHPGARAASFLPAADARLLLGASFNFVLDTAERVRNLLDVCAALSCVRVERVVIPAAVDASRLADALLARVTERA